MAKMKTGTVVRIWRGFGRVRLTVTWQSGATRTITLPKAQCDATIRTGDTIGTIVTDPPYTAEDLIRWNTRDPAQEPAPMIEVMAEERPVQPYYQRISGPHPP